MGTVRHGHFAGADKLLEKYCQNAKECTNPRVDLSGCFLGVPCTYLTNPLTDRGEKIEYLGKKMYFLSDSANENEKDENARYIGRILNHIGKRDFTLLKGKVEVERLLYQKRSPIFIYPKE